MNITLMNQRASGPAPEHRRARGWLASAIVLLASCAGGEVHKASVAVKGLVTIDGKPLEKAVVVLIPDSNRIGRASTGNTDKTGAFSLTTYVDEKTTAPGIEPGNYTAIVTKLAKVQPRGGGIKSDIPTRYADVNTSDLKVVITEEPEQTVKLELLSR